MCRIAAYQGPEIPLENIIVRPAHSLLAQSRHAQEAKLAVNGDGFGISWYGEDEAPGVYRDVTPAWGDENLENVCRMVRSRLFIGHVRASTYGKTTRANCHPFTHKRWSFCHNGQIPHFASVRRKIEAKLPDALYDAKGGTTDSEVLFLALLANGLDRDPKAALMQTITDFGTGLAPVKITAVFSDGASLYGFRYASKGRPPSLYVSGTLDNGGRAFASEPLDGISSRWTALAPNELHVLNSKTAIAA